MLSAPKLTGLSGNEIYCMRLKGLIPNGVVIGNSIQSMGFLGGEIPDVTRMIHEGRAAAFARMCAEADREQVHGVVGIKTYIVELGPSLVEIFAVGTAIRKLEGMKVATAMLPAQAIIRDKDTCVNGVGGFEIQTLRAGN